MRSAGKTVRRARQLRRSMSLPEVLLWQELRKRPNGLKFRRQHPAGPYVIDFYCLEMSLAIEIDGESHDFGDRPTNDAVRDGWLQEQSIRVLRIPAREILSDLDAILRMVLNETSAATQALRDARAAFAGDSAQQARFTDAAKTLGVPGA